MNAAHQRLFAELTEKQQYDESSFNEGVALVRPLLPYEY